LVVLVAGTVLDDPREVEHEDLVVEPTSISETSTSLDTGVDEILVVVKFAFADAKKT